MGAALELAGGDSGSLPCTGGGSFQPAGAVLAASTDGIGMAGAAGAAGVGG